MERGMSQQLEYAGTTTRSGRRKWLLPSRWGVSLVAMFLVLVGMTVLAYALARSRETLTLHSLAEADAIALTQHFQNEIDEQLRVFRRLKWNYIAGRYKNSEDLRHDVIEVQQTNPVFLEVGEADSDGHVLWVWPTNNSQIPSDLMSNQEGWAAVKPEKKNARDITAVWLGEKRNPKSMALGV